MQLHVDLTVRVGSKELCLSILRMLNIIFFVFFSEILSFGKCIINEKVYQDNYVSLKIVGFIETNTGLIKNVSRSGWSGGHKGKDKK